VTADATTSTPSGQAAGQVLAAPGRRRSSRHMLLGAVLVLAFSLIFYVTALRTDPRTAVLALARAVPAGHALTDADLMVARIVPDSALAIVPATQRVQVIGRTTTMPLAAYSLLSPQELGPGAWPPAGSSVIAVAVKAGRMPTGVNAGAQVTVLVLPPASSTGNAPSTATPLPTRATVVSLAGPDPTGASVVSLLLASADALRVAGSTGEIALVLQGSDG
jgi:hypothetical protein